jgi:hypothetical protein
MTFTGDVHVRWRDNSWRVEVLGEDDPRGSYTHRSEAWQKAQELAQRLGVEAVLHSRGGYVRDRTRFQ